MTYTDGRAPEDRGGVSNLLNPRTIGVLALILVFIVWAVANGDPVVVDFIVAEAQLRLFVALILAGLIGAAVGFLAGSHRSRRR